MIPSVEKLNQIYVYSVPDQVLSGLKPLGHRHIPTDESDLLDLSSDEGSSEDDEGMGTTDKPDTKAVETMTISNRGSPVTWYTSKEFPPPLKVGIYTAMLPEPQCTIQSLQLDFTNKSPVDRTIAMIMLGGGHFQGTIISLNESSSSKCAIKASKGFHRYTTRRKQGGSQSANDNAKGAANSAGAQIRRYNEIALADDIRSLFKDWNEMLDQTELILIRASGQSSRKLLYENGLKKGDSRIRGFPLNTRRATQAEIIRSFHILTRLQTGSTEDDQVVIKPEMKKTPVKPATVEVQADPAIVEHTDKLSVLFKRNKVAVFNNYLAEHKIDVIKFRLEPTKVYGHTPTLLHLASSTNASLIIHSLLDRGADPTVINSENQTPFEVAGSKPARDAFRIWRGTHGNEDAWDWETAKIPAALTADQIKARQAKETEEKAARDVAEETRRKLEVERLEREAQEAQEKQRLEAESKRGPGRSLAIGVLGTSASTSLEGLTPEMKKKIERERRARAAEARFGKK